MPGRISGLLLSFKNACTVCNLPYFCLKAVDIQHYLSIMFIMGTVINNLFKRDFAGVFMELNAGRQS